MGVVKKGTTTRTNANQSANRGQEWEKAAAFLNISLPTVGGDNVRVDSIKLKESNVVHRQIMDKLTDPDLTPEQVQEKLKTLVSLLIVDFQVVRSDEEKQIAF